MSRLLDDLLDIARITRGKIQLQRTTVRLGPLADEAVRVIRPAFESGKLTLEVQLAQEPLAVHGDPARLQQILVNLLMNGVKYTPPGGRIRLDLAREGGEAVVRVRDTGMGIRPEMLEKVFELFVQADDSLHRTSSGLGVGLTLVKSIAELHGGRVRASSAGPGRGSEFVVWLPLAAAAGRAADTPKAAPPDPPAKILIVEDNDDSRRMLETILKLEGHEVRAARDGEEGLAAIHRDPPTVALVDIGLPNLDGYELARRVRASENGKAVYLVALTGYGRGEDRKKVADAGFDEHLVKPLKRGDLEQVLTRGRQRQWTAPKPEAQARE
jgi:two-component system CheB/CheR fusion protein